MHNKDKPWFDDQCRHAFGLRHVAHLRWTSHRSWVNWEEFVCFQVRANETYSVEKNQFSDRNRDVLMNVHSTHKCWSTFKSRCSARVRHCLCSLARVVAWCVSRLARLICCRIILTASSPGRLMLTCHPSPSLTSFAFRSSEVRRLLLDFDPYGGTDLTRWVCFLFFLRELLMLWPTS